MAYTRKHYLSITKEKLTDSPHCNLGGQWFVKKIGDEEKFYVQKSNGVYQEMPAECFNITMQKSSELPTQEILKNLKEFKEAHYV
jgi:hypothetical protein